MYYEWDVTFRCHYCQYTEHGGLLIEDGTWNAWNAWNVKCEHLITGDGL